jgi:hypothetical protein
VRKQNFGRPQRFEPLASQKKWIELSWWKHDSFLLGTALTEPEINDKVTESLTWFLQTAKWGFFSDWLPLSVV